MHMDPALPHLVGAILIIFLIGLALRAMNQPHVVAYILAGLVLGPHGIAVITDPEIILRLGAIGVVFLLFFVGMEIAPQQLAGTWRVSVLGTLLQVLASIGLVYLLGHWLNWPLPRIMLIGFVISLSSTAVVLKMLQDWGEIETNVGQNVIGVLIAQDILVIPMLLLIGFFSGTKPEFHTVLFQLSGGILMVTLWIYILKKGTIHLPFQAWFKKDQEMQVFGALTICFGMAWITGLLGLSTALGAFAAGMIISAARETQWVRLHLEPFRVVFLALFFVSIGMQLDLGFFVKHWWKIGLLVLAVLLTNTFINTLMLKVMGESWRASFYAGALLGQIGEFSFVLVAVGLQTDLITNFAYQITIAIITLTLLLSPSWVALFKKLVSSEPL